MGKADNQRQNATKGGKREKAPAGKFEKSKKQKVAEEEPLEDEMLDEENEDELYGSEAGEEAFDELEKEAKMLRVVEGDESDSDESAVAGEGAGDENAEFLNDGQDLDLPSEVSESEEDEDLKGADDTDSELENYYEEIGIADEADVPQAESQEQLYRKKAKAEKAAEKAEQAPKE